MKWRILFNKGKKLNIDDDDKEEERKCESQLLLWNYRIKIFDIINIKKIKWYLWFDINESKKLIKD